MKKIFELYMKNRMPHFWVIQPTQYLSNKDQVWQIFQDEFLKFIHQKHQLQYTELNDCPDFMILKSNDQTLKVEQMNTLESFQQRSALYLDYQFIVLVDSQLLQITHWNKMLKTLEEPLNNTIIMILNPSSQVLMPTISSRAYFYHLDIPLPQNDEPSSLVIPPLSEVNQWKSAQFLDWYGQNKDKEKQLIGEFIREMNRHSINFTQSEKLINLLKWSDESIKLNNNFKERALILKQALKQLASQ